MTNKSTRLLIAVVGFAFFAIPPTAFLIETRRIELEEVRFPTEFAPPPKTGPKTMKTDPVAAPEYSPEE